MRVDYSARKRFDSPRKGDWELSFRRSPYTPFGVFLTTPRFRLWCFLRA